MMQQRLWPARWHCALANARLASCCNCGHTCCRAVQEYRWPRVQGSRLCSARAGAAPATGEVGCHSVSVPVVANAPPHSSEGGKDDPTGPCSNPSSPPCTVQASKVVLTFVHACIMPPALLLLLVLAAGAFEAVNQLSPHIYLVAGAAFRDMVRQGTSQSLVINGESGAGKTETTKKAMQFFAALAGGTGVEGQVLEVSAEQEQPIARKVAFNGD